MFRNIMGTSRVFEKILRALVESLSNYIFLQPWRAAYSIAKMIAITSA